MIICVELADRYITDREFPDKAFDILDEVGSRMQIDIKLPEVIEKLKQEAQDIKKEKVDVIKKQNYEQAAELRDKERRILKELDIEKKKFDEELKTSKRGIPEELIYKVVKMDLPLSLVLYLKVNYINVSHSILNTRILCLPMEKLH